MLNYQKLDPKLNQVWEEIKDSEKKTLDVFIKFSRPLNNNELNILESKGIHIKDIKKRIVTAVLSKNEIEDLSDKSWIKQLNLSRKLKPLD